MSEEAKVTNNAKVMKDITKALGRIVQYNSLVSRSSLYSGLGSSYDGERDLYTALGYKQEPTYSDYVNIASRDGFGKRVNEAPCDAVWSKPPIISDTQDKTNSPFEEALQKLVKQFKLWNRLNRLDKLLGFGPYSVLVMGFNDVRRPKDTENPVKEGAELVFLQCYPAEFAEIKELDERPYEPTYGMPKLYEIRTVDPRNKNTTQRIVGQADTEIGQSQMFHASRVLHIVEGNLSNELYGEPRLKVSYNRLQDIEKVVGGAAEMFWRGARPGYVAALDPEFNWDPDGNDPSLTAMKNQITEYEHNLRRILTLRGVDMKGMDMQLAINPNSYLDMQLQGLSAGTQIPKRLLTGSERGELASSQDRDTWFETISIRRETFCSPVIVEPLLDKWIELGLLPAPKDDEYFILWPDLKSQSEKDRADVGNIRSNALRNYVTSPAADLVIPPESFIREFLGLDEATAADLITQLQEYLGSARSQETQDVEPDEGGVPVPISEESGQSPTPEPEDEPEDEPMRRRSNG